MERAIRKTLTFVKPKIVSKILGENNIEALKDFEKVQVALGRPNR